MTIQPKEKFFYASGAISNGVKADAFTFFLLFFYSNVIGLTPGLASLAIFIALMVDAFTDPLMGAISDRTKHRYGRRHPYFLVGMIPMSLSYFMLFAIQPSWELSQENLFIWMLTFTLLTRLGMTIFEVPHRSLGAEMTRSYTERTSIFATREMLGWFGGLFNAFLAYTIFFKDTPVYMPGTKNPEPWIYYGMTGASIMCLSVLLTYFGTLKYRHNPANEAQAFNLSVIFQQIKIALKNKSFINKIIGIGGIIAAQLIAKSKMDRFSKVFTKIGTIRNALKVAIRYMPKYDASIVDGNSQKYVFMYICNELPIPQPTATNK